MNLQHSDNAITKVTQVLQRVDGSEAKIVVEAMFGAGLHRSIDTRVFKRSAPDQDWQLCSTQPAAGWREMSVDDYIKHGRSETLQTVTHGEILKLSALIGQPMPPT